MKFTNRARQLMLWGVLFAGLSTVGTASAGTIADAAAQPTGTQVTIDDALILSTTDLVADPGYRSFQLRDVTRAITVYGTNAEIEAALTGWVAGDGITIEGVTRLHGALNKYIDLGPLPPDPVGGSVGGFAVTGRNSSLPMWPLFPTNALAVDPLDIGQSYQSDLVCLQNVSFDVVGGSGFFAAESNYALAGNSALVRIATADLGLVGQPIPTGLVDITGIVMPDPDGDGYVLAPRGVGDIVPEPATLGLIGLAFGGLLLHRKR